MTNNPANPPPDLPTLESMLCLTPKRGPGSVRGYKLCTYLLFALYCEKYTSHYENPLHCLILFNRKLWKEYSVSHLGINAAKPEVVLGVLQVGRYFLHSPGAQKYKEKIFRVLNLALWEASNPFSIFEDEISELLQELSQKYLFFFEEAAFTSAMAPRQQGVLVVGPEPVELNALKDNLHHHTGALEASVAKARENEAEITGTLVDLTAQVGVFTEKVKRLLSEAEDAVTQHASTAHKERQTDFDADFPDDDDFAEYTHENEDA